MKQRTNNKNEAKKIKSDDFTRRNREKSNIAIVTIIFHFGGTNDILEYVEIHSNRWNYLKTGPEKDQFRHFSQFRKNMYNYLNQP